MALLSNNLTNSSRYFEKSVSPPARPSLEIVTTITTLFFIPLAHGNCFKTILDQVDKARHVLIKKSVVEMCAVASSRARG